MPRSNTCFAKENVAFDSFYLQGDISLLRALPKWSSLDYEEPKRLALNNSRRKLWSIKPKLRNKLMIRRS